MDKEAKIIQKYSNKNDHPKIQIPIKGMAFTLIVIIIVICAIISYNYVLQKQLKYLKDQNESFNNRIKQIEINNIEDVSLQQIAEKLEYVMSQQEVNVATTQEMVDYMTFTFTLIGVFFLLVSGYFVYRQQRSEKREEEGWVIAKELLDLVTQSQQFVVHVQEELKIQQDQQKSRQEQTEKHLRDTVTFLNNRADILVSQFARDNIFKGFHFARLVDISNRIDNTRFQVQTVDLNFSPNCYFLKAVYEFIIGNYNTAKEEFDKLILEKEEDLLLNDTQQKQLSLCYYYRGLIEYNVQENLDRAEDYMNWAVERDPQINGPDFKSMLLKAEIKFKKKNTEAYFDFKEIVERLENIRVLNETQNRLLSYAYLGMANCKILEHGKKFLPAYYKSISQLDDEVIAEAIMWLNKSKNSHIYTFLTLAQLSVIFEKVNRNVELERSAKYFEKCYELIEKTKPYEAKHEPRGQILAHSVKLVCEKFLDKPSLENTKLALKDLLNDRELKAIYSIFSKVNVSKVEYLQELKEFGISGL